MIRRFGIGLVAISLALGAGCSNKPEEAKKEDKPAASAKADGEKKAEDKPAEGAAMKADAKPAAATVGRTLAVMPDGCAQARVFVDLKTMLGEGAMKDVDLIKQIETSGGDAEAVTALKSLVDAGLKLPEHIEELSMCMKGGDSGEVVMAVGLNTATLKGDLITAIEGALKTRKDGPPTSREKIGGVDALVNEKVAIAFPAGGIIVVGSKKEHVEPAIAGKGAADFAGAKGSLVWSAGAPETDIGYEFTVKQSGETIQFRAAVTPSGDKKATVLDPKSIEEGKKGVEMMAGQLAGSPFADLAEDLKKLDVKIEGEKVVVSLDVPRAKLASALTNLAKMPPEALLGMAAMGGGL